MTTIAHATLVMERTYNASPARVFAAWESVEARERWSAPRRRHPHQVRAKPTSAKADAMSCAASSRATLITSRPCTYLDIRRDQRIVFAENVTNGDKRVSAALISVELSPPARARTFSLTLQIASFDDAGMEEGYQYRLVRRARQSRQGILTNDQTLRHPRHVRHRTRLRSTARESVRRVRQSASRKPNGSAAPRTGRNPTTSSTSASAARRA